MKKQYPYRFKTKAEMIKDYGCFWKDSAFPGIGWNDEMDHLLGKDYPFFEYQLDLSTKTNIQARLRLTKSRECPIDTWTIVWDMLVVNVIEPNYKSKKIVRTL